MNANGTASGSGSILRVAVVFGTRPECIKMFPVLRELRADSSFQVHAVVAGQHRGMLDEVMQSLDLVADARLEIVRRSNELNEIVEQVLAQMDRLLTRLEPDLVLVQGDTTTAFGAALAAFHRGIRSGHVEAGLRSLDRAHPYPEEVNRRLISVVSDLHFAPTLAAANHLVREGVRADDVFLTGNTVVDALLHVLKERDRSAEHPLGDLRLERPGGIALITLHRRESWILPREGGKAVAPALAEILRAIWEASREREDVDFVFPVHRNPHVRDRVFEVLGARENVHLVDPIPYVNFIGLMADARLIITDSGGIQEEAPTLGIPVLVTRQVTERPEGLESGAVRLVGVGAADIKEAMIASLSDTVSTWDGALRPNPYGDGQAAARIRAAILHAFGRGERPEPFAGKAAQDTC